MPYTVDDEKTSPFAPDSDHPDARTPRLPDPPAFPAGDAHPDQPTLQHPAEPVAEADDQRSVDESEMGDDATRQQPAVHAEPGVERQPKPADEPTEPPYDTESLYRPVAGVTDPTTVSAAVGATAVMPAAEVSAEERKLAAERAARREAREQALAQPDVRQTVTPEPVVITRRTTDRFLGAFALFLLRLVVAGIMAVRGLEVVTNLPAAEQLFATTIIPEPRIAAMVAGYGALAIAVALVFGLLTRLAGLGITLITAGALVFVLWGNWSPFVPGRSGFIGELELLLAVVGLVFLCVGAGGFSLDRSFRKSRERDRRVDQGL